MAAPEDKINYSSEIEWKAFSLTLVEYPQGDNLGLILAITSLLPVCLIISFVTLIVFRRDIHTICFFIGVLLCEVSNLMIKNIIGQPRPHYKANLYTEYGMPSSHAQVSWFFATYCILFLIFRLCHNHDSFAEILWKSLVVIGLALAACFVSYSRVYLLYHTWSQIIWGSIVGIFLGSLWFSLVHVFFYSILPHHCILEFLRVINGPRHVPHPEHPLVRVHTRSIRKSISQPKARVYEEPMTSIWGYPIKRPIRNQEEQEEIRLSLRKSAGPSNGMICETFTLLVGIGKLLNPISHLIPRTSPFDKCILFDLEISLKAFPKCFLYLVELNTF